MKRSEALQRLSNPSWVLSQVRDGILNMRDSYSRSQFAQFYRIVRPYTMSSNARLRGLYEAVLYSAENRIPGDVVECGTARGGSAALMGLTINHLDIDKRLWVFDTFEGLPAPTAADPDYDIAKHYTGKCKGELSDVISLFERLEIIHRTNLVKGLFQESLLECNLDAISVLHLDGDWYESLRVCLNYLYDRVSPGGIIQIDDYGHWEGAKKAVDEFFVERNITVSLRYLDYTGRQFTKP